MSIPSQLIFLPGASGSTAFWQPLADRITLGARKLILPYPGFGQEPADLDVSGIDDLVHRLVAHINQPTALIAQSMGGILAVRAALERPDLVTHLVLSVTSGGIDMQAFGAADWRADLARANPSLPSWFASFKTDLTREIASISAPTLLLWGDSDPISPLAVGEKLLELLPNAHLHVIPGGRHDLAHEHAHQLAPIVEAHLRHRA